jgi:uncharacterized protein
VLARRQWLLLFIGAVGGAYPLDQIRIMKGMFLIDQTPGHPASGMYRFDPYDYGPFDSDVYRDLDALEVDGLVEVHRSRGSNRRTYSLTDSGRSTFRELVNGIPKNEYESVEAVKLRVTSLGFEALLHEIYREFPTYAVNSRARLVSA